MHHGDIAPDRLFGAGLFDPARKTPDVRRWLNEDAYHDHHHAHHDHDDGIAAFCLSLDAPMDWQAVSGWLAALRQWRGADLLRVKGILCLRDEDRPVVIHGVHHIFHPPVRLDAWPDADHRSRIVFITRGLPQPEVEALAREARVLTG